jgi:hypothetical protein
MKIDQKAQKKIIITVNEKEFENFKIHKSAEGKSGQFLAYRALEKAGLFKSIKDSLK